MSNCNDESGQLAEIPAKQDRLLTSQPFIHPFIYAPFALQPPRLASLLYSRVFLRAYTKHRRRHVDAMPMKRRLPNKPNHHHRSRNNQQNHNQNQKGQLEQKHRPSAANATTQAAQDSSEGPAQGPWIQSGKFARRLRESGSGSESSSTASDEGQALLTPDYHRTRPIGAGASSRIGTRRTSRASDSPSLGARLFVSPYNPQNLPALLLALLASIYAHALVFGDMAIAMGLGKLWVRSQQGAGGEDGDMGMDMLNEGAEQVVGREVGGKEKKVKRRKKGSGGELIPGCCRS